MLDVRTVYGCTVVPRETSLDSVRSLEAERFYGGGRGRWLLVNVKGATHKSEPILNVCNTFPCP